GEGAGHQQHVGGQRAIQLRKAQVIAHAQADTPALPLGSGQLERRRFAPALDQARFVLAFAPVVKLEEVNLVVARHAFACRREDEQRIAYVGVVAGGQRQGSPGEPDPQVGGGLPQEALHRTGSEAFARCQLVPVAAAHEAEIFRQHGQLRAGLRRLLQQGSGAVQVALKRRSRNHLDRGDFHQLVLPMRGSLTASARPSAADLRLTRVMRGSAQVPSIWNSWVAARIRGWRRNSCARKVPSPMAGLITLATSEAVPALISGMTTTLMSCVSRAMSALPSISTAAFTPFI